MKNFYARAGIFLQVGGWGYAATDTSGRFMNRLYDGCLTCAPNVTARRSYVREGTEALPYNHMGEKSYRAADVRAGG